MSKAKIYVCMMRIGNFFRAQCSPCLGQSHHDVQACWTFKITFSPKWKKRQIDINFFWQRMNQWQNIYLLLCKCIFFYNCRIFSGNVYLDLNALSMYPPYPHDQCQTPAKGQMRGKALKAHRFLAASTRYVLGMWWNKWNLQLLIIGERSTQLHSLGRSSAVDILLC